MSKTASNGTKPKVLKKAPADERSYRITNKELDQISHLNYALRGIIQLAKPQGEERSITCACLCALLEPITEQLVDWYCDVSDRCVREGGAR
jgi:hypothetical protein